jgi:hypothetical protein
MAPSALFNVASVPMSKADEIRPSPRSTTGDFRFLLLTLSARRN